MKSPPHRRKSSRKAFKRRKKDPHNEANVAKKPLHGKKAFKLGKPPPPWGDKRSNKAPFLFHDLYTTANAIYQLDIRFGLS